MTEQIYPPSFRVLIYLLLATCIIFALIIARQVFVPIAFSVLFAYGLFPAADKLEQRGLPRIATNFLLILFSIFVVAATLYGLAVVAASFFDDLPQIRQQLTQNINEIRQNLINNLGISEEQAKGIQPNLEDAGQLLGSFFTATANTVIIIGLIPVYTFLLLYYRNKFKEFISQLFSSEKRDVILNSVTRSSEVIPHYIKGLFIVCFLLVIINSTGFLILGIDYAVALGIMAAIFNLIPYLGTVIGYGIVFLFVFILDSPTAALGVLILFFIVQFTENNLLTPNITGSQVEINPLVTIISLIIAGMTWGLPGMFMIIPYLAIVKIFCDNIPDLKPVGFLLGTEGTEQHAISLKGLKKTLPGK